jgi:diguanylate cyclase (GGDEF)-like protein
VLLDVRTMMLMAVGITAVLAFCLAISLQHHRAPVGDSARCWIRGTALQSLAWLAFALRDQIPDVLSVLLGNLLICLAYAEYPRALRVFRGSTRRWHTPQLIALCVVPPVVLYTWLTPSVTLRTVTTSMIELVLLALGAREAVCKSPRPWPTSHRITAVTFICGAALLLVRIVYEAVNPQLLASGIAVTPMQCLTFGYMALAPVLLTFGFVLMCTDYTRAELEKLAATDPLTGVLNRRMLGQLAERHIASALRYGQALSVLLIDVDRFKSINDAYGHEVGDQVLQHVVKAVQQQLRPGDLVGRVGGEEFLIVLGDTDAGEAALVAERLRIAVTALDLPQRGVPLALSISIGVASLGDRAAGFDELVRHADRAMYLAKRGGRNRVVTGEIEAA